MIGAFGGRESPIMRAARRHENRCRPIWRKTADFQRTGTVASAAALFFFLIKTMCRQQLRYGPHKRTVPSLYILPCANPPPNHHFRLPLDRKSVVEGKRVSVRDVPGGRQTINK